ncbi:hypothetical protein L6164_006071 [Bauhinia variegata]|uniref:Uncharacterized protein n=1 Tax=Bauhinia variegata TaxID=167791 RepID=A0ACB9PSF8_BAUVA|nr:hypothetical protein L6164_006071 [Bauhinia variegata]
MLKEMERRGCNPNFVVYSTLVTSLHKAGKLSEAHEVIRQIMGKGKVSTLKSGSLAPNTCCLFSWHRSRRKNMLNLSEKHLSPRSISSNLKQAISA